MFCAGLVLTPTHLHNYNTFSNNRYHKKNHVKFCFFRYLSIKIPMRSTPDCFKHLKEKKKKETVNNSHNSFKIGQLQTNCHTSVVPDKDFVHFPTLLQKSEQYYSICCLLEMSVCIFLLVISPVMRLQTFLLCIFIASLFFVRLYEVHSIQHSHNTSFCFI